VLLTPGIILLTAITLTAFLIPLAVCYQQGWFSKKEETTNREDAFDMAAGAIFKL